MLLPDVTNTKIQIEKNRTIIYLLKLSTTHQQKEGVEKQQTTPPSDNENANQKLIFAPTSNPIFLSLNM